MCTAHAFIAELRSTCLCKPSFARSAFHRFMLPQVHRHEQPPNWSKPNASYNALLLMNALAAGHRGHFNQAASNDFSEAAAPILHRTSITVCVFHEGPKADGGAPRLVLAGRDEEAIALRLVELEAHDVLQHDRLASA